MENKINDRKRIILCRGPVNSCQCEKAELLHKSLENSVCILYPDYYDNQEEEGIEKGENEKEEEEEEEIMNPYEAYDKMHELIYKKIKECMKEDINIVVGAPFHSRGYLSHLFDLIKGTNYDVDILECMTISPKRDSHHQTVQNKWPRSLSQIIENQFWIVKTKNMRKNI